MSTEPAPVIVYSRPSCVQCTSTTRALDRRGIRYEVHEMTEDDAARFKAQGHMQAPVVVTEADTWAGFRPDKISTILAP
ncbi:NrdH-redoxin [Micrococcus flavus]|nr:glutaredoxin domain-containing protein [Micrococcus flavus]TFH98149.1 NrdH-redoxin [Micrococcus flavus]